ncbi:MAG: glycerol acyltransferase [Gammaproteobacteria bacterium]|nr:glycerol acyltransferase [Gammaproteobacteria bacterium]
MSGFPYLPPETPQVKSWWRRGVGQSALRLGGWRIEGNLPNLRKFVLIVAPHTSNWDFIVGFTVYLALRLETVWLAKHTVLRGPLGPIGRYFGGVAIDRTRAGNIVQAYIDEFAKRERMVLTLTPEGTRSRVSQWRKGFHNVARSAGVPVVPVALDFSRRRAILGPPIDVTDDYIADLVRIKPFFKAKMAKDPSKFDESLPIS